MVFLLKGKNSPLSLGSPVTTLVNPMRLASGLIRTLGFCLLTAQKLS